MSVLKIAYDGLLGHRAKKRSLARAKATKRARELRQELVMERRGSEKIQSVSEDGDVADGPPIGELVPWMKTDKAQRLRRVAQLVGAGLTDPAKAQEARAMIRAEIEAAGFELRLHGARSDEIVVAKLPPGMHAQVSLTNGLMRISERTAVGLEEFGRGEPTVLAVAALKTLFHEHLHLYGPAPSGAVGEMIDEICTETVARGLLREVLGPDAPVPSVLVVDTERERFKGAAPYRYEINGLIASFQAAGLTKTPEAAERLLVDAAREYKRGAGTLETAEENDERWIKALQTAFGGPLPKVSVIEDKLASLVRRQIRGFKTSSVLRSPRAP